MNPSALARRASAMLAAAAVVLVGLVTAAVPAHAAVTDLIINEFYGRGGSANQPFTHKFVELHNPTGAAVNLAGTSIQYRSAAGTANASGVTPLTGTVPAGGYFLIQLPSNGSTGDALPKPDLESNFNPSGTTGTIFLASSTTAITPDNLDLVIDKLGFGGSNSPEGTAAPYPGSNSTPGSLTRTDHVDTDDNAVDFTFINRPTPQNSGVGDEEPPDPVDVKISQIQGAGMTSSIVGQVVIVEAVVTAVKPGLSGFYVQEEEADHDNNQATSEAIFVFGAETVSQVEVGQLVRVTGTVAEFTGSGVSQTQLTSATVEVLESSVALPTPTSVSFPVESTTYLERFEGMLVELVDELVISEYFNYDRFGEVVLAKPLEGDDRLHTPTAVVDPGRAAQDLAAEQALRIITLDDYFSGQNPTSIPHPGNGEPFSAQNSFRGGDTVTGVVGVIDHTFGLYRIQPTEYGEYAAVNPRTEDAPDVGGSIQVASFNVLNYFRTLDRGRDFWICGASENMECRGADGQAELDRQRAKLIDALAALDADVVGLMEMENTPGVEPAADLVEGLNDVLGEGTYDFIDTGVIGTDAIRLGFLYKPGTVRPVGDFAILDTEVDPRFLDDRNRPMLTQTFDEVATGARMTVSVNHLKSKGSACTGDPDLGDGQGNCNVTRVAAAEAIVDFLSADPTASGDPDHLVIGDLNSYDHEDPIHALVEAGYTDLVRLFGGDQAYGYVFDGKVGYLDHALSNASLTPQVTGAAEWHINADEPDILDYNLDFSRPDSFFTEDPFRSSDHDPVLVGLDLDPALTGLCYADDAQSIASFDLGARANRSAVPPPFRVPGQALGTADGRALTLGLKGEVVIEFDRPVQNNNGSAADLRIVDKTDGAPGRQDAAIVYGSWDSTTWVELNRVTGTGEVDLGSLSAIRFVKVVDDTLQRTPASTDGYDLDAVEVLTGCA